MRSYLYVFFLSHYIFITARIAISTETSCSNDQDCFPSGGRKCCFGKCSGRKYCGNYCTYDGDCDISKQENCTGNKCTTEVGTLKPGRCQHSYECNNLTEICVQGVCKEIKGVATMVPKSGGGTNSGSSLNSLTAVLAATIIPAVIVIALIFGVCFANHKIRAIQRRPSHASDEENIET